MSIRSSRVRGVSSRKPEVVAGQESLRLLAGACPGYPVQVKVPGKKGWWTVDVPCTSPRCVVCGKAWVVFAQRAAIWAPGYRVRGDDRWLCGLLTYDDRHLPGTWPVVQEHWNLLRANLYRSGLLQGELWARKIERQPDTQRLHCHYVVTYDVDEKFDALEDAFAAYWPWGMAFAQHERVPGGGVQYIASDLVGSNVRKSIKEKPCGYISMDREWSGRRQALRDWYVSLVLQDDDKKIRPANEEELARVKQRRETVKYASAWIGEGEVPPAWVFDAVWRTRGLTSVRSCATAGREAVRRD